MFLKQITANNLPLISCKTNGKFSSKHRNRDQNQDIAALGKYPAQ